MKAIVYKKYGTPDVLKLKEVEKPNPKENEVLINVQAAAANAADWHMLRGKPFLARLDFGLFKPKNTILGIDIAGRVEAIGNNVIGFKPGDEVFGDCGWGAFAEYVCVKESNIVLKPANATFEEAAAVPVSALTALQGIRNKGEIQAGQKVLINGASGGVGTFAVQIAKSFDTEVTGVCGTTKLETTHSIGADHVIDYTKEDFTKNGKHYDLIIDVVGNRSVSDYKRALIRNGRCVIVGFTSMGRLLQHALQGAWSSITGNKKVGLMGTAQMNKEDLTFVKKLIEAGKVKPVIDRRYPLSDVAEAIRYLEKGHARGKVVITVENNNK
ncbi:MAG: NAD(P)-dependent alcohol dehydrogenase [Desulfobacteraceae bacterium]|nr:NAD(P)-dependent alcohol dehydrogenase [Desulfobacteraceae bacterium]